MTQTPPSSKTEVAALWRIRFTLAANTSTKEDAKISVFDHGLLYGDGVFEGLRAYGGKVFRLDRAHRAAVRIGQGDLARDSDVARRR